jgi:hypothetical protein
VSILVLFAAAALAGAMLVARWLAWRYHVRQIRRRRERRGGYLPIFDQDWTPKP